MTLQNEIQIARRRIYRDGYDMSLGEITSLYNRGELTIQPEYQRLFRWDATRKTRFIESLLLNIPIPPIFVFSGAGGKWELIDGLQRISTVLEYMGELVDADGHKLENFVPNGTDLLPSLEGKIWPADDVPPEENHLGEEHQITIRRARIRIEILGQETDPEIKFELFQRLNTGGANLSEQEIRNCIIVAINRDVYHHLHDMASDENFLALASIGEERTKRQFAVELAVRFVVLRNYPYRAGLDVHNYLDKGIVSLCSETAFNWNREKTIFRETMRRLREDVGTDAFRKNNRWSIALFEFVSLGVSKALEQGMLQTQDELRTRLTAALTNENVERYSGSGIRGTQRLSGLVLPFSEALFTN